jgi:hypothetical protein
MWQVPLAALSQLYQYAPGFVRDRRGRLSSRPCRVNMLRAARGSPFSGAHPHGSPVHRAQPRLAFRSCCSAWRSCCWSPMRWSAVPRGRLGPLKVRRRGKRIVIEFTPFPLFESVEIQTPAARTSLRQSRELRTTPDARKHLIVHVVAENDGRYLAQFHWLEAQRTNWACRRATAPR